ncbi:class I SAM-dependent methyltransferase [Maricaulaceae bacterium EIL42A08]|nr:class I SAM-dependent methyltransferase [Maricaulaceae bacterium EIL42A08]
MRTDALEIDRFYRSKRGRAAREMVLRRLRFLWSNTRDLDILGYGYASPYLSAFSDEARRTVAYMPAEQGAVPWTQNGKNRVALGDECRLPFVESLFDRVILVHALEEAEDLRRLLREVWRVMAPEARLMVICTHRGGLWARVDSTPFGHGRPFSRTQLNRFLTDALFEPTAWSQALYAPPWRFSCGEKAADGFEAVGERLYPAFGGLLMAEAVKHVGAVRPGKTAQRVSVRKLEGVGKRALSPNSDKTPTSAKPHSSKKDVS